MGGEGRETGNGAPQPAAGWARSPLRGAVPRDAPHPIIGRETERDDADEEPDGPRGHKVEDERAERDADEGGQRQAQQHAAFPLAPVGRSEEHTSELQSLMRISYAVFCLTKKKTDSIHISRTTS